jgi:hypothetical protein
VKAKVDELTRQQAQIELAGREMEIASLECNMEREQFNQIIDSVRSSVGSALVGLRAAAKEVRSAKATYGDSRLCTEHAASAAESIGIGTGALETLLANLPKPQPEAN